MSPSAIYNLDETGLNTDPRSKKCFIRRGAKDAITVSPTSGKTIYTVLFCGNADGTHLLPPFVIYKAKNLHSTWCRGGPPGTAYSVSSSGWMETLQFENWIDKFVQHKHDHHGNGVVVLFVDGHYTHLTYNVRRLCKENNVCRTFINTSFK
jgi:prepilin-type processing-associated H-X9-DG protein